MQGCIIIITGIIDKKDWLRVQDGTNIGVTLLIIVPIRYKTHLEF